MNSYEEGQKAYQNGQRLSDNPYDEYEYDDDGDEAMSIDFIDWDDGWMDAESGVNREKKT